MGLPPSLNKMEVQEVMSILGYTKSLLPEDDLHVYVGDGVRFTIDFVHGWDVPSAVVVLTLAKYGVEESDIVRAYRTVYPC